MALKVSSTSSALAFRRASSLLPYGVIKYDERAESKPPSDLGAGC